MDFEAVYNTYFKDLYRFLLRLTGDEGLAQELTSDTFFKTMEAIGGFRGQSDLRVWLCQIAKNAYYSHQRKAGRLALVEEVPSQTMPPTEERLFRREEVLRLHAILHSLPEPYKEVFTLRVFGELRFRQIGSLFGCTANWACVTYHRARQKILKRLEEKE